MKKFAAYQTNKRKFDDRGGRGGGPGEKRDRPDRPRREKPREGREPELNIFIDKRFNVWNLPVKAKVLLASNLPQVIKKITKRNYKRRYICRLFVSQIFSTIFSHSTVTLRGSS